MFETFIALLFGHAIADYALQDDTMGLCKNPKLQDMFVKAASVQGREAIVFALQPRLETQQKVPWGYWMTAHGMIHGSAVWLITGNLYLGMAEAVCHGVIDLGKCTKLYGIHVDQALHVVCKVAWVVILYFVI